MPSNVITGDFARLAELREKLEQLAQRRLARPLAARLAEETQSQIASSFATGISPSGQRWAPLTSRSGSPLVRTGALRASLHVTATDAGVQVRSSEPYARVQQFGGRIRRPKSSKASKHTRLARGAGVIPPRPFLPASRWGPAATARLRAAANDTVHRFLRS